MQQSYYYWNALSSALHNVLQDATLMQCFCQDKDELVLGLFDQSKTRFLDTSKPAFEQNDFWLSDRF